VFVIFGQRDDKMRGVPIHSETFDPLKFIPVQQSISFGKSGLAPKNNFACDNVNSYSEVARDLIPSH